MISFEPFRDSPAGAAWQTDPGGKYIIYYYKEYNIFAYHEKKEHIEEFYDYDDYEHPLYREYYDENSRCKIIYEFDKSGNIIEIKEKE